MSEEKSGTQKVFGGGARGVRNDELAATLEEIKAEQASQRKLLESILIELRRTGGGNA